MIDLEMIEMVARERSDFTVLMCLPVALPYWRLRLRVEILARRDISPLEQFVMRASEEADTSLRSIQSLLGLDDQTFSGTVDALANRSWVTVRADHLHLTATGKEVVQTAQAERPETRALEIDFDGLLRRPELLDLPVDTRQRRALGLREIPARPAMPPDLLELNDAMPALQSIIRRGGDGRDQEVDLLAIKGILRTDRMFRQATLAVLRSRDNTVQAAPIVDGVLSDEHEQAMAQPEVTQQMRLSAELRRGRRHEALLPLELRSLHDPEADEHARALRDDLRRRRQTGAQIGPEEADAAEFATNALKVRVTYPHEHPRLVTTAIRTAQNRVVLATSALSDAVLDRDLLGVLEAALKRGVTIDVAHAGDGDGQSHTWLRKLAEDYPGFQVQAVSALPSSTMVRDDNLALRTTFPLLGHFGRERPFRDERGWLITRPEHVMPIVDDLLATLDR